MKNMIKDAMILFAITLVAGLLLGVVNEVTKEPIALAKEKAKRQACQNVFADAASFEKMTLDESVSESLIAAGFTGADIDEASYALDANGNKLGAVVTVTDHEGYGGDIQFSIGITNDGVINGISILSISETAGLGMEAGKVLAPQFQQVPLTYFTYTKNGKTSDDMIDAISGATITTKAVVNGVNAGVFYFENYVRGGELYE